MWNWLRQHLVWNSTLESIAGRKISLLAVSEIVFSVWVYWMIATRFGHLHIMISVIATPLLLLRSDRACETARIWWIGSSQSSGTFPLSRQNIVLSLVCWVICFIVTLIGLYGTDLSAFWCILLITPITANMAVIFVCLIFALVGALDGKGARHHLVAAHGNAFMPIVGVLSLIPSFRKRYPPELIGLIVAPYLVAFTFLGWIGAHITVALWIRIASVLLHIRSGIKDLGNNWSRTMTMEDFFLEPSLIPGIGKDGIPATRLTKISAIQRTGVAVSSKLASLITFFFGGLIWIFAQLWRWSIKSTCWFYFPLYLLFNIGAETNARKRGHVIFAAPGFIEWLSALYAMVALMIAIVNAIEWRVALDLLRSMDNSAPFGPLSWWFVTDWSSFIERPWQWFHLPAVVLTLVCFLWQDRLRRRRKAAAALGDSPDSYYPLNRHPGKTIYLVRRIQHWCAVAAAVTGMWFFAKWVYQYDELPAWATPILRTLFDH